MLREFRRIILSRTDRIGDVVLSLPAFASLKNCLPESELTALVREYTAEVVRSHRAVDNVCIYDPNDSFLITVSKLKRLNADAILFLYPRLRLAAAAFAARIPVRVGTAYRWYSFLFNRKVHEHRKDSVKSEAEYNLSVTRAIGCDATLFDANLRIGEEALEKARTFLRLNDVEKFIAVHPGSGGSAADWSTENFRSLCKLLTERLNSKVIITGLASEKDVCAEVCADTVNCINAAGAFALREFIAFLSLANSFVSNSTGPIHLAASVGTPVVGIYPNNSPMTPVRWAPLTEKKIIVTPSDGSDDLSKVTVDEVFAAVRSLTPVNAG